MIDITLKPHGFQPESGHLTGATDDAAKCPCRPRILQAEGGTIAVHNSYEPGRKPENAQGEEEAESEKNPQRLPHHWSCRCVRCLPDQPSA